MGKQFGHLNQQERTLIYWWRKAKLPLREILCRLRRSHTSIRRELKRNRWGEKEYFPRGAQMLASYRLRRRAKRKRLKSKQGRTN